MTADTRKFLDLLTEMLAVPAPSGREEGMADLVRRHLDAMGYAHETDGAGNVLVRMEGRNPDAPLGIFAAHMDEIALVVTRIEQDGTLRAQRSGGLYPYKIGERPIRILGDAGNITTVISFGSGHGGSPVTDWKDVRLLTGLSVEQLREAGIRPGSTGVPLPEGRGPIVFGDPSAPMMGAWTFDDRAGVAVQLQLLAKLKESGGKPPFPAIFAFTVHEEGGCHGAKVLANREKPEIFIAIDGCPWNAEMGISVDDRPVAWSKDQLAHYNQKLIGSLSLAAGNAGSELQTAVISVGYSDASAVYQNGGAARVGIIGHSRHNSHGFEVARLAVFSNVLNTLVALMALDEW